MNPTLVVYLKEMRELMRDKRIRNTAIVTPMFLVFGMLGLFGFMSGIGSKENQTIYVVNPDNTFVKALKAEKVNIVALKDEAEGETLIKAGKAQLMLRFDPQYDSLIQRKQPTEIKASYDPQATPAKIALGTVKEHLAAVDSEQAKAVLESHQIAMSALTPVSIKENEIKIGKEGVSEILLAMLPYFIVIWAFYGGMSTAADLVAGEKEKLTLETLLIAPVGRSQIAFGKFLALASICLMSSLSAVVGFFVAGQFKTGGFLKLFPHGLGIGLPEFATIVLLLLPTVAFFASLLLAISTYAKNSREAQSYLTMVSFVVIMPAIFGQVIGFTDLASKWWIRLVPVLNTSVGVREALQGKTSPSGVAITVAMGTVLAFIGIRIAVSLFKREQVLTRI